MIQQEVEAGNVIEHPIEEKIPYYDNDHHLIKANEPDLADITLPEDLEQLHLYLNDPSAYQQTSLELFTSGSSNTDIAFLDHSVFVVLDTRADNFFLYDVNSGQSTILAPTGRGPGDIAYTEEMRVYDNNVYIAMEDMRISSFTCHQNDCVYKETIPLDYSALSVAKVDSGLYAVLALFLNQPDSEPEIDGKSVRLVNSQGKVQEIFGDSYKTDQWILLFSINDGMIRHHKELNTYVLTYSWLPYLYIFDENLALAQSFRFENFTQGTVHYMPAVSGSSPLSPNRTTIDRIDFMGDRYALIVTTTRHQHDDTNDPEMSFSYRNDYYALDLHANESYHLGARESEKKSTIYPNSGTFIMNKDGELFQIERAN
ncbi:MAG: hypothetical protein JJU13_11885 [Balneolaceae bacterium]|nr:hypothetical protein [Balneolaceae bacterium]